MKRLGLDQFRQASRGKPLFDVRTPAEFAQAHIPGATNLPLFTDEQRAVVGTSYKQDGRHEAIKIGLDFIGPRMRELVEAVEAVAGPPGQQPVFVHCWRGGMRSGSVAWLLDLYGWEVFALEGGYKAFRRWVLARLEEVPALLVLGGRTGSGKTRVLHALAERGEAVLDLEGLANHRGSSFGALELPPQPSQEQFEALLAVRLDELGPAPRVWVEDESRMVGTCMVPATLMHAIRESPVVALNVPIEVRVAHLVEVYGDASRDELADAFRRIEKRLGGERTAAALQALADDDLATAARIGLEYYDKTYDYGLSKRPEQNLHWVEVRAAEELVDAVLTAGRRVEVGDG